MKKFLSKSLSIILIITMLFLLIPLTAFAITSDDYIFMVEGEGTAKITGYTGAGGEITIPETLGGCPVAEIRDYVFRSCASLTSVNIPNSVTSIGSFAFEYCTNLRSVTFGNSMMKIGDSSFKDCDSLSSIMFPSSLTSIARCCIIYC